MNSNSLDQKREELKALLQQLQYSKSYDSVNLSDEVDRLMQEIKKEEYELYSQRNEPV